MRFSLRAGRRVVVSLAWASAFALTGAGVVVGATPLVDCASAPSDHASSPGFPEADRLTAMAAPATVTKDGFRLGVRADASRTWTSPASPVAELPRSAAEPIWMRAPGESSSIGIVRESLGAAPAALEGAGVVRYAGDAIASRVFAHHSEIEELVHLERPNADGVTYRWALPEGARARLVATGREANIVEVVDADDRVLLRMRADRAWDATGRTLGLHTSLEGDRVRVAIARAERDVAYPVVIDPSWFAASSPIRIRSKHTATLLGTGEVLFAGGGAASDSSELYDVNTARFAVGPTMTTKRSWHTATLLASGRVLLAGGTGLTSAEIYDPIARTFTPTGSLSVVRAQHTAVRLRSGKVLVTAGTNDPTTEIYDEATGTFTPGPPRAAAGAGALVTLPSGKVLFAAERSVTQIFDPDAAGGAGAWIGVSVPPSPSAEGRTATLLRDGRVFITSPKTCGSSGQPVDCGASGELFDPLANGIGAVTGSTGDFTGAGAMATLLPSGEVVLTGGGVAATSATLFDPTTNKVTADTTMSAAHTAHTATVLPNGGVLVFGGDQAAVELRPARGRLTTLLVSMTRGRTGHSAIRLRDGNVLVLGGGSQIDDIAVTSSELYSPTSGTFTATGALTVGRSGARLTMLPSGNVLVTGGVDSNRKALASAEIYDVATGTFRAVGSMATDRQAHAALALPSGNVLVSGGACTACGTAGSLTTTELFDPKSETFRPGPPMLVGHQSHGMIRLPTGKILLAGDAEAELYDPIANTFASTGAPGASRDGRTLRLLSTGKAFLAGGSTLAAETYDPDTETWSFTGAMPFTNMDIVWTGTADGRVLSSGGKLFEGVVSQGIVFDPLSSSGDGVVAFSGLGRTGQTATLMTTGGILVTGGETCYGNCVGAPTASAAIWSDGAPDGARPVVSSVPSSVHGGETITIEGHGFASGPEGSNGGTQASAINAPQVLWLAETGDAVVAGKIAAFTDTSITWTAPATALADRGWIHVSTGGVISPGVPLEVLPANQAVACEYDADCGTGFCTDGVCCERRCDGNCEGCSAARKLSGDDGVCGPVPPGRDIAGRCFAVQGQACSSESECATGFCVSGVCCDSSCTGTCLSCTIEGHVGSCSAISEGACDVACDGDHTLKKVGSPDVDCAPFKCDGKSCRDSCASARDCVAPNVCNLSGLCVPPFEAAPSDATVWGCAVRGAGPEGRTAMVGIGVVALLAARRRRGKR